MKFVHDFLPQAVNVGPWITAYTLFELRDRLSSTAFVLPICSLGTSCDELTAGISEHELLLPPLFHEAMTDNLRDSIIDRIHACFPLYEPGHEGNHSSNQLRVRIHDARPLPEVSSPKVLAFSVDTAVEEHGPHLPLATDTIQSYSVLFQLEKEIQGFIAGQPVEYGHLTWGLPFGMSIDLTPELLTRYVTGFANAVLDWHRPEVMYVVDVHGSIVHRQAIIAGLEQSRVERWAFRWLHEPLIHFASERGDQHAGGVETALVEHASSALIDKRWFPARVADIEAGQMTLERAVELTPDLQKFIDFVDESGANGIVGKIRNYESLDAASMFQQMLAVAREDVRVLQESSSTRSQHVAGDSPWERDRV
ncbi:MAG: creatininase family protein [Planctomycetota bacterium]|nr:creatininase family protein [Planctomycetota bacterium]MDA1163641.1 creatininase family protein [Planctomycetota bacterium]